MKTEKRMRAIDADYDADMIVVIFINETFEKIRDDKIFAVCCISFLNFLQILEC